MFERRRFNFLCYYLSMEDVIFDLVIELCQQLAPWNEKQPVIAYFRYIKSVSLLRLLDSQFEVMVKYLHIYYWVNSLGGLIIIILNPFSMNNQWISYPYLSQLTTSQLEIPNISTVLYLTTPLSLYFRFANRGYTLSLFWKYHPLSEIV